MREVLIPPAQARTRSRRSSSGTSARYFAIRKRASRLRACRPGRLTRRSAHEYVAPTLPAKLHFALGEPDRGFALLEKAYAERDQSLTFLKIDLDYKSVRNDPRYREMVSRLGL